jgi:predicted transcriptional regulator
MKYRSRTEIIAAMLQISNNGATKTRIMYGAYLSYSQVKEYLGFLLQRALLHYEEDRAVYTLTTKGMNFLRAYEEIDQMIALDAGNKAQEPIVTESGPMETVN